VAAAHRADEPLAPFEDGGIGGASFSGLRSAASIWSMEDIVALVETAEAEPKTRRPWNLRRLADFKVGHTLGPVRLTLQRGPIMVRPALLRKKS
jgi:hypothetical protein